MRCGLRRDPSTGSPTLVAPGPACAADTYLEVDYDNGDVVKVTWSETTTSFDLKLEVIAGPWTGTNLHYTGNLNGNTATVVVTGAMLFSRTGSAVHVAGEAAWVICTEIVPGGSLAATNVFVRERGGWHMVHHHASPLPRPAPRPAGFRS